MTRSHTLVDWNPEDTKAWDEGNAAIARRNMIWSIATDHVAFGVWTFWSVLVLFMPESVYGFSAGDKFLLVAVNTLIGALTRIPYTVGIGLFGGRNFTVAITLVLLIPAAGSIWLLANPGLPLWPYLVCAALTGLGGGNFSASMTNINAFYPQRLKGWALGLNAGGGNIGVPVIQLIGLLVIAVAGNRQPYWVCGLYMALLTITSIGAIFFMDNIEEYRVDFGAMRAMLKEHHTWVLSLLYVGSFGSFIGFSFALGQVLHMKFSDAGESAAQASLHAARSPSSDRCWGRCPGSTAASWPTASAAGASPWSFSAAWWPRRGCWCGAAPCLTAVAAGSLPPQSSSTRWASSCCSSWRGPETDRSTR